MSIEQRIIKHEDDGSNTEMVLVERARVILGEGGCEMTEFYEGILPVAVQRALDGFRKKINNLETENLMLLAEIDEWKAASGLECGGDPDGVTPKACRDYWENFERINTSPVLYWTHSPMGGGDSGWNQLLCHPDHRTQPTLRVIRGQRLDAAVSITCRGDNDDEVVIAEVLVPFRDDIAACSVCAGDGCVTLNGDTREECPWCLGVESTAMDEAKEIACALYWSWLRSPNGGGEKVISPLLRKHSTRLTDEPVNSGSCNDGELDKKCDQN